MRKLISHKSGLAAALVALSLIVVGPAGAERAQKDRIVISAYGNISPSKLPRDQLAPVGVQMGAKITTTDRQPPPRLSRIILDINTNGVIDAKGLATCALGNLNNSSASRARRVCGEAEVGKGNVTSRVKLPGQEEFATNGPLIAFNGKYKGKQAIFAHVTSKGTLSITYVIIFVVKKSKGTYGTSLVADVPEIASGNGYISAFDLSLRRQYSARGEKRSYVAASCPLPKGVPVASFPFARSTYEFEDAEGTSIPVVLRKQCRARN